MSHVRRKPPRHPTRAVHRKKKTNMYSIIILLIITISVFAGIVLVAISTP